MCSYLAGNHVKLALLLGGCCHCMLLIALLLLCVLLSIHTMLLLQKQYADKQAAFSALLDAWMRFPSCWTSNVHSEWLKQKGQTDNASIEVHQQIDVKMDIQPETRPSVLHSSRSLTSTHA